MKITNMCYQRLADDRLERSPGLLQDVSFRPCVEDCILDLIQKSKPEVFGRPGSNQVDFLKSLLIRHYGMARLQNAVVEFGDVLIYECGTRDPHGAIICGVADLRQDVHNSHCWEHRGWFTESEIRRMHLPVPPRVVFFMDGKTPKYKTSYAFDVCIHEHLRERKNRLPSPYRDMDDREYTAMFLNAVLEARTALNLGIIEAVPYYADGKSGNLMIPLCMNGEYEDGSSVDGALVLGVECVGSTVTLYPCTILDFDMAFFDARQIGYIPANSWLRTGRLNTKKKTRLAA